MSSATQYIFVDALGYCRLLTLSEELGLVEARGPGPHCTGRPHRVVRADAGALDRQRARDREHIDARSPGFSRVLQTLHDDRQAVVRAAQRAGVHGPVATKPPVPLSLAIPGNTGVTHRRRSRACCGPAPRRRPHAVGLHPLLEGREPVALDVVGLLGARPRPRRGAARRRHRCGRPRAACWCWTCATRSRAVRLLDARARCRSRSGCRTGWTTSRRFVDGLADTRAELDAAALLVSPLVAAGRRRGAASSRCPWLVIDDVVAGGIRRQPPAWSRRHEPRRPRSCSSPAAAPGGRAAW